MKVTTKTLLNPLNEIFVGVWVYGAAYKMINDLELNVRTEAQMDQVVFAHLSEVTRRSYTQSGLSFARGMDEAEKFLKAVGVKPLEHGMAYSLLIYARMMTFIEPEHQVTFNEIVDLVLKG